MVLWFLKFGVAGIKATAGHGSSWCISSLLHGHGHCQSLLLWLCFRWRFRQYFYFYLFQQNAEKQHRLVISMATHFRICRGGEGAWTRTDYCRWLKSNPFLAECQFTKIFKVVWTTISPSWCSDAILENWRYTRTTTVATVTKFSVDWKTQTPKYTPSRLSVFSL